MAGAPVGPTSIEAMLEVGCWIGSAFCDQHQPSNIAPIPAGDGPRLIVATKVRGEMWKGADGEGLSGKHIERAAEDSLRRLQVERIDLYQCHWPDEATPIEETLAAFDALIRGGKVRYIGASNYSAEQLDEALAVARAQSLPSFVSLQPHYNLMHRKELEADLEALCLRER